MPPPHVGAAHLVPEIFIDSTKNIPPQAQQQFVPVLSFAVPPHSLIDISFSLEISAVEPTQILRLDHFVRELLDPAAKARYDALKESDEAGGLSILGLLTGSGDATDLGTSFGLDQSTVDVIHARLRDLQQKNNRFTYKSHVDNRKNDTGSHGQFCMSLVRLGAGPDEASERKTLVAPRYTMRVEKQSPSAGPGAGTEPTTTSNTLYPTSPGPITAARARHEAHRLRASS